MNNVCNVAPCHLPDIDPTIDHTLVSCKERYKEGRSWAGRGTTPVNELA